MHAGVGRENEVDGCLSVACLGLASERRLAKVLHSDRGEAAKVGFPRPRKPRGCISTPQVQPCRLQVIL